MKLDLSGATTNKLNASELAYRKIKEKILSGAMPQGMQLKEIVLKQELGLTHTPIREALRRLESEHLIQMIPNRGAFVPELSAKDVNDILDTREALETKAIHLACRRANREELDHIRDYLEQIDTVSNKEKVVTGYIEFTVHKKFDFHYEIVKLSKNNYLISAWETLQNRMALIRATSALSDGRGFKAVQTNKEILRLIYDGKSKQAQRKMAEHIDSIKNYFKKLLIEK